MNILSLISKKYWSNKVNQFIIKEKHGYSQKEKNSTNNRSSGDEYFYPQWSQN